MNVSDCLEPQGMVPIMDSNELRKIESTLDEVFDDLQVDMTQAFEESLRLDELKPSASDIPSEAPAPPLVSDLELHRRFCRRPAPMKAVNA